MVKSIVKMNLRHIEFNQRCIELIEVNWDILVSGAPGYFG